MTDDIKQRLAALGLHTSGRKVRSDSGKQHSYPVVRSTRSDVQRRKEASQLYASLKSRLLQKEFDPEQPDYVVQEDCNGIFIVMVKHSTVKRESYVQIYRNRAMQRSCRHIAGYETDLEQYRFYAIQNELSGQPFTAKQLQSYKHEIELTKADCMNTLFARLYRVKEDETIYWSYKKWREQYEIAVSQSPDSVLPNDFQFDYSCQLSSVEYRQRVFDSFASSYEATRYRSKLVDKYTQRYIKKLTPEVLSAHTDWSMNQVKREVTKMLSVDPYKTEINIQVNEEFTAWAKEQLEFDEDTGAS